MKNISDHKGFNLYNDDFIVGHLAQLLTPEMIKNISQINVDNMIHHYPTIRLKSIRDEFVERSVKNQSNLKSFLQKYFSWSKDLNTFCEIIEHGYKENQFVELEKIIGGIEIIKILRLHGLQVERTVSLIRQEYIFDLVKNLFLVNNDFLPYSVRQDEELAKLKLLKKLEMHEVLLHSKEFKGTYFFANKLEYTYRTLFD